MKKCPVCESIVEEGKFLETYISPFNRKEYKLYYCLSCDLQWWEPLKIIPEFYENEGDESYTSFHLGILEGIGENHRMFFEHIPLKSGRLLDIGCGDGRFLKEAERRGYEVWGIDFDSKSIKVCQEKRGLKNTFAMTLQEFVEYCKRENLKFDVVTFFEVLEHQDDPKGFLELVKEVLKPGGYVAGSVPNRDSWLVHIGGRKLGHGDCPPHHFLRFSPKALKKTFALYNFADILIRSSKAKISEITPIFQVMITGNKINKLIKKAVLKNELARENTVLFREASLWRKTMFKGLKFLRNIVFFIPAIYVKIKTDGIYLYFQARKI